LLGAFSRPGRLRAAVPVVVVLLLGSMAAATTVFAVNNLINHGGPVMTKPKVFVTYWGSEWSNGFSTLGFSSDQYRDYLAAFISGIGGGSWLGTQTQYNAGNPPSLLGGIWVDTFNDPVPQTPTRAQIEAEVARAVSHFGFNSQGVYVIALPTSHGDTAYVSKGGPACAWHQRVKIGQNTVPYITLPYATDAGFACGTFRLNTPNDQFGHSVFDGISIVLGHEYAEVLTDPFLNAWWAIDGENADKCAWQGLINIGGGGNYFAVQPLWSNVDASCRTGGSFQLDFNPASLNFGLQARSSASNPMTVQATNNGDIDFLTGIDSFTHTHWAIGGDLLDFELSNDTCGKVLHPGQSCQVDVTFRPTVEGSRQGSITLALSSTCCVILSGFGGASWMALDPISTSFDDTFINSTAPAPRKPLTLTNTGDIPRLIQRVRLAGPDAADFIVASDNCTGATLDPSSAPAGGQSSCTVDVAFAPTATGERRALLEMADASGAQFGSPLTGRGLGPAASLSASSLFFADAALHSTRTQSIVLTNSGQSPLVVQSAHVTGDFALATNGCRQPVPPGGSCTIAVSLTPMHFQGQFGTLTIADNTSESPHEVELAGSATAAIASLAPDRLDLGFVPVGSTSPPQTVNLANLEGETPLHIQSIIATGDFAATSDCPEALFTGDCSISVTLKPTAVGPRTGTLVVTDDAPGSPHRIPLAGSGVAFPSWGAFVVGDGSAAVGHSVTFWGAQWWKKNSLSGGAAPAVFKGFADTTSSTPPTCGGTWSTSLRGRASPPRSVPDYLAVLVSRKIERARTTLSGEIAQIVAVKTDPGYGPAPGHAGTGTVVTVLCGGDTPPTQAPLPAGR